MKLEAPGLHEITLEHAIAVCLVDPGAKDEGDTHQENHVVEVHRTLDCKVAESPYLACQLSVFDDWQRITGVPGMVFEGLWRMQNSTVNAKRRTIYTGLGPLVE